MPFCHKGKGRRGEREKGFHLFFHSSIFLHTTGIATRQPALLASVSLLTTKTASALLAPTASLQLFTTKLAFALLAPKASLPLLAMGSPSRRGKGEEKGLALSSAPHHENLCPVDCATARTMQASTKLAKKMAEIPHNFHDTSPVALHRFLTCMGLRSRVGLGENSK